MSEYSDRKRIRVLVVDDYEVVRSGLKAFLSACDDLEPVGEAANGADTVRLCDKVHPDVVIMGMTMPGMDGVAATRLIHLKYPHIQVIVLAGQCEDETVRAALEAGAISYLLKNISPKALAGAIRAAQDGQPTLSPEAMQALAYSVAHHTPASRTLTSRERQVLGLMAEEGLNNQQTSDRLAVSRSTIKVHVGSVAT